MDQKQVYITKISFYYAKMKSSKCCLKKVILIKIGPQYKDVDRVINPYNIA